MKYAIVAIIGVLVGQSSVFAAMAAEKWKIKRKLRPIPLPGMSREEHDTEVFIEKLHDNTCDDIRLTDYEPIKERRSRQAVIRAGGPLALGSVAHIHTDSMRSIKEFLKNRKPVPQQK